MDIIGGLNRAGSNILNAMETAVKRIGQLLGHAVKQILQAVGIVAKTDKVAHEVIIKPASAQVTSAPSAKVLSPAIGTTPMLAPNFESAKGDDGASLGYSKSVNWQADRAPTAIINSKKYSVGGFEVQIDKGSKPEKFEATEGRSFEEEVKDLQDNLRVLPKGKQTEKTVVEIKEATTDEAIYAARDRSLIALNFANEHHAGGDPGMCLDSNGRFQVTAEPAKAQEEALSNQSNLLSSLVQLGTTTGKYGNDPRIRNKYNEPFDSKTTVYVSNNQLFAIRAKKPDGNYDFFQSHFLKSPVEVSFVTSAGAFYRGKSIAVSKESDAYKDAEARIKTHLLASAHKAMAMRMEQPNKPVELVLGAFGCGAFAPTNADEYAKMIAAIYKELLPQFNGIFDKVTFAIPTNLGANTDANKKTTANYNAFAEVLGFDQVEVSEIAKK